MGINHRVISFLIVLTISIVMIGCTDWDLIENTPPESVVVTVIGQSDSTITIQWDRSESSRFSHYTVYYDTTDTPDTSSIVADTLYFNIDTVKTVTKLLPSKRYYFRVLVHTTEELFSASSIVTGMTLPKKIITLSTPQKMVTPLYNDSIVFRWQANWNISPQERFTLYYDTTKSINKNNAAQIVLSDSSYVLESKVLRSVHDYYFVIEGTNSGNSFITSDTLKIGTAPQAIGFTVQSVDSAIAITWNGSPDGDFKSYYVLGSKDSIVDTYLSTQNQNMQIGPLISDVSIVGGEIKAVHNQPLVKGTVYHFTVGVVDVKGNSRNRTSQRVTF